VTVPHEAERMCNKLLHRCVDVGARVTGMSFLTMPVSWKGTMIQYAGRLHRLYQGKFEVCIYDYVDRNVPMLVRMFEKRLRAYRAMGYGLDAELATNLKDEGMDEDE
jgi:hypothetical protein